MDSANEKTTESVLGAWSPGHFQAAGTRLWLRNQDNSALVETGDGRSC